MYPIIRFSNRKSANLINFKPRIGSGSASVGERFIEANGRDIMLIGNNCGTCNFYFELIDGLEASILDRGSKIAEKLNIGLNEDWDETLNQFAPLLPNGQYFATHRTSQLLMHKAGENSEYFRHIKEKWPEEFEGEDHHVPKTPYFRAKAGPVVGAPKTARLFEFVIPTVPLHTLDKATISEYRLRLEAGERPTALAISVLDVTDTRGWEPRSTEEDMHWCLAHYLLDGHHKTVAASQTGLPLRILSFTSVKHSMAAPEIIELCLQHDASEVGARDPSTE